MKWYGILALLLILVLLAGIVYIGMNSDRFIKSTPTKTEQTELVIQDIPKTVKSEPFDVDEFKADLKKIETREELDTVIREAISTTEALQSCAKLYKETVTAIEAYNPDKPETVRYASEKQQEYTDTYCEYSEREWMKLVEP